jgi:hypothetical protein
MTAALKTRPSPCPAELALRCWIDHQRTPKPSINDDDAYEAWAEEEDKFEIAAAMATATSHLGAAFQMLLGMMKSEQDNWCCYHRASLQAYEFFTRGITDPDLKDAEKILFSVRGHLEGQGDGTREYWIREADGSSYMQRVAARAQAE